MGWARRSAVAAGVILASLAAVGATPQGEQQQTKKQPQGEQPQIKKQERVVVRPQIELSGGGARLGVALKDVDAAGAKERKLPAAEGALVVSVEGGSAAEKAGIKGGDVITSFDGERVRSVRQLQRLVGDTPPGREVKVSVLRDGRKTDLTVAPEEGRAAWLFAPGDGFRAEALERSLEGLKNLDRLRELDRLRDLPRDFSFRQEGPGVYRFETPPGRSFRFEPRIDPPAFRWNLDAPPGGGRLGVLVQELTPQLAEYFGAKEGVLVSSVSDGSPAAQAGVKAGDVITSVNGEAVDSPEVLLRKVREQPDGRELSLGIVRDRKAQALKVKLLPAAKGRPI